MKHTQPRQFFQQNKKKRIGIWQARCVLIAVKILGLVKSFAILYYYMKKNSVAPDVFAEVVKTMNYTG